MRYRVRAFYLGMKPIDSWRPAQTTLLVEVVRGAAGLFVPAAAASIHKTSLFVEHGVQTMIRPRGRKRPPRCTTRCVCGVGSPVMKGQACRCGGEGTTIACVLAVFMTCVTWIVVEIVTLELVAVMRHSVEV